MNNDFVLFWNQESASMIYWCAKQLCWVAARLDQKCSSLNDMQSEGRTGGMPQADLPFMLWQGTAVPVSLVQLLLQARWSWRSDLPKGTKAAGKRAMARMAVPSAAHSPGSSHSQWDRSPLRWWYCWLRWPESQGVSFCPWAVLHLPRNGSPAQPTPSPVMPSENPSPSLPAEQLHAKPPHCASLPFFNSLTCLTPKALLKAAASLSSLVTLEDRSAIGKWHRITLKTESLLLTTSVLIVGNIVLYRATKRSARGGCSCKMAVSHRTDTELLKGAVSQVRLCSESF